jgi:hypothetical protein
MSREPPIRTKPCFRLFELYRVALSVAFSTVYGITAGYGGAIETEAYNFLTVINSTFVNNSARVGGGIDDTDTAALVTITNSTFSGNSGSALLSDSEGTGTVTNSIFAKSVAGNCDTADSTIADGGYNISDDASCGFGSSTAANGDTIGDSVSDSNLALAPSGLANNGGPTETIALELGSYAIAAIPTADCPTTDQRGATRPAPGYSACDIGAFEYAGVIPTPTPTTKLVFGSSLVGNTDTKNLTVKNTGTSPLFIGSVISNDPAEFFATGATTCPPGGLTVGRTCTIAIGFTPNAVSVRSGILTIYGNSATTPQSFVASGTGTADLTLTKSTLVFGDVKFGLKGVEALAVVNHQTQSVSLSESFSGTNAADFSVSGGTCATTLAAGKSCSIIVSFAPSVVGTESATLSVSDTHDPLSPHLVALSTGPTIPVTITPVTLAYGTLTSKTPSKIKDETVTNKSGFPLSVSESFTGPNATDFTVTGGTCGSTAPANSSCTIAVTFTPTASPSPETASMGVTIGSDPTSPHKIALTGTGP